MPELLSTGLVYRGHVTGPGLLRGIWTFRGFTISTDRVGDGWKVAGGPMKARKFRTLREGLIVVRIEILRSELPEKAPAGFWSSW